MKTVLRISLAIFAVLLWGYAVSSGFDLANMNSDMAFVAGFALIVAASAGLTWSGQWMYRRWLPLATLLILSVGASGCYTVVEPGHVGIRVSLSGSDRGVNDIPISTGRVFYNPFNQRVFEYPTYVQTATWTANPKEGGTTNDEISFNSKDGIRFNADISLSYQIDATKVPTFYVKFRNDDLNAFTHGFLHNIARDGFTEIAPQYTTEEVYSTKMGELVNRVRDHINEQVKPFGVEVQQFGFIGAPRPPQNIMEAINAKSAAIQQAQQAQNKLVQATAEASQAVAKAEGEARSNQALTSSLSPNLIEWRRLEIQQKLAEKWNGALPTYSLGNSVPLIELPTGK